MKTTRSIISFVTIVFAVVAWVVFLALPPNPR